MQFPESNTLELELTSKCTVKCPNCPRTFQSHLRHLWDNGNIDDVKLIEFIKTTALNKIILTGAYGDGIYHPQLVKTLQAIKDANITFSMDTNGSYRKPSDWEQIAELMTKDDQITFSIDGTPENFTQYRVNADWPSIKVGAEILAKKNRNIKWKYIVFKYNCSYEDMKLAYDTANEIGFTEFELIDTHRAPVGQLVDKEVMNKSLDDLEIYVQDLKDKIGPNLWKTKLTKLKISITPRTAILQKVKQQTVKWNKPKGPELSNKEVEIIKLPAGSKQERNYSKIPEAKKEVFETENVYPQCMNVKNYANFISSEGLFLPCCFMRVDQQWTFDQAGITPQDVESMNIYKHTYKEVINGSGFKKIMDNFENMEMCRRICGKKKAIKRVERDSTVVQKELKRKAG